MDFEKLLSFAEQVQQSNTKHAAPKAAKKFSANLPPPRKEEKKSKGIQSEAVRAFLEKQKREEEEKVAKERERKQQMLNAKLEAKKKADEEKRKEEEEASFIPSNFASGPRRRVGAAITRPRALVPTVNPCLVKAPNPCLVKAPNPCLVKDLSSEKPTDSKRASSDGKSGSVKKIKKKKPIIKKPPGKPPLSFEQLLQIAQKKHTIPVDTPVVKVKEPEEQRPMTKEEKEQYLRRHTKAYQAWLKFGKQPPAEKLAEANDRKKTKLLEEAATSSTGSSMNSFKHPGGVEKPHKPSADVCNPKVHLKTENGERKTAPKILQRDDVKARINGCSNSSQQNMSKLKSPYSTMRKPSHAPSSGNGSGRYISTRETVLKCGSQVKMVKASPVTERVKPMNPWDRIYGEIQKNNPKPERRKRPIEEEEDEEEYDEDDEEDDFIADDDDGDETGVINYSKYIKDIFGYDKNRFQNERDDDLRGMESSYSQVVKEERMSARLGIKEDLEDIRKEEEEKKRKLMKKAKKMKYK
ncbi:hypothetical protein LSAT2_020649 [Lamellibrachia satsuma]|nr:hypothetical protein LSAT2_020649 [Lamellibrachia satsuma]